MIDAVPRTVRGAVACAPVLACMQAGEIEPETDAILEMEGVRTGDFDEAVRARRRCQRVRMDGTARARAACMLLA